jgi:hypothetical protein
MLSLGMGRAQVAATFIQAKPGTRGPKSWPTATSQQRVRWSSRSWHGDDGGKANRHNFRRRRSSLLKVLSFIVAAILQ